VKEQTTLDDPSEAVQAFLLPAPSEVFRLEWWVAGEKRKPEKQCRDVRIRLLRLDETHRALAAAQRYAKELGEIPGEHRDIYREAQAIEIAWRCMVRVEERERADGTRYYPPIFTNSDQLRQYLTEPQIAQILNCYEIVKAKYGAIEAFSVEEVDTWAARISDPLLGDFFLSVLDSAHWVPLLQCLAQEDRALREEVGRPLPNLAHTSGSDLENSTDATGSFSELPEAHSSESGESLPQNSLLTRSEALERVKGRRLDSDK